MQDLTTLARDLRSLDAIALARIEAETGVWASLAMDEGFEAAVAYAVAEQLGIDTLAEVAATRAWPLTLNRHAGYDHSYYFVASFIEAHLRFHANHLGEPA